MTAFQAGQEAWRDYGYTKSDQQYYADLYQLRQALYTGEGFADVLRRSDTKHLSIYRNTTLLWKHVNSIVTYYAMTVYQGDLSTDGSILPDGSLGAIPIVPQTGSDSTNQQLIAAIAELNNAWNWRQKMTQIPERGAALGDLLTELVDEDGSPMVYPSFVWPGYVKEIELDYVDNLKAYTLQYMIDIEGERFLFRKAVDGETIQYFRGKTEADLAPYGYNGNDPVIEHGYGFCPAVWDRHKVGWGVRGEAATDSTRGALIELNSLLSHGKHFQHKAFSAPIIVTGQITGRGQTTIDLSRPPEGNRSKDTRQTTDWLQGSENAGLVQPKFDLGSTLDMVTMIRDGIIDENPEARFFRELRGMTQVTGPGAERLLGDAVGRTRLARGGYDAQMKKRYQMAIAMCGHRARLPESQGGWPKPLTRRQAVFLPFDLNSFAKGDLDFEIAERPVVMPTKLEVIDLVRRQEMMQTRWGLGQIGIEGNEAESILADRVANLWQGVNGGSYRDLITIEDDDQ